MKFTSHERNHVEVNDSGTVSTFAVLFKHHPFLVPEHSHPPEKETLYPSKGSGIWSHGTPHFHLEMGSWEFGTSPGPRMCVFGIWSILSCRHLKPDFLSELTCLPFPQKGADCHQCPRGASSPTKVDSGHNRGHGSQPHRQTFSLII